MMRYLGIVWGPGYPREQVGWRAGNSRRAVVVGHVAFSRSCGLVTVSSIMVYCMCKLAGTIALPSLGGRQ